MTTIIFPRKRGREIVQRTMFKVSRIKSKDRRQELRKRSTRAENILWGHLKGLREFGCVFRRQHSIGWYIADFYCPRLKLVIELDGGVHERPDQKKYDNERDEFMKSQGLEVHRFKNEEIENDVHRVMHEITKKLGF